MTSKEKALTEAEAAAKAAAAEFCTASTTYVTAIDRYGDVLNATAPTVGDVKEAGSDLAQPGEDAQKAAGAVADTRKGVATAEQELADAQAALVTAQASASGTTPSAAPSSKSPSPSPTPASVTRVQEAQKLLHALLEPLDEDTRLCFGNLRERARILEGDFVGGFRPSSPPDAQLWSRDSPDGLSGTHMTVHSPAYRLGTGPRSRHDWPSAEADTPSQPEAPDSHRPTTEAPPLQPVGP